MNAAKLLGLALVAAAGASVGWWARGSAEPPVAVLTVDPVVEEGSAAGSETASPPGGEAVENTDELAGRWREAREAGEVQPHNAPDQRERDMLQGLGYLEGYEEAGARAGVTVHDPQRASAGWNFVTSGHGAECSLLDMQGRVLHRWSQPPEGVWPDYFAAEGSNTRNKHFFRRALLLPDGHVVALFAGLGIVRVDAASELVWARRGGFHHHLAVGPEGNLWVLDREKKVLPRINPKLPILEDFLVVLSPDGEELRRISLLECFERSEYRGVLDFVPLAADIFHTNTLQILDGSQVARSPHYAAGNLLVSVRHTNTIAIVDPTAERVVWALSGNWRRQHEPILLDSGNLLLLDNMPADDHSRVIEIDPFTQEVAWELAGSPELPFHTRTCGVVQRLPNGNTLITESDYGRAFEVTREKELVWEWISPHRAGEGGELVATLFELKRLPADFPVGDFVR